MTNNLINFISDSLDLEYEVNVVTDGDSETLVLYDGVECVDYETIDNHTFLKDSYLGGFCGITSIVMPKTVTNINCNALNKCKWLESIVVSDDNETYSSQDGVLYDKNKTKLYYVPPKVKLTELVLPDTVTEIVPKAFLDSLQSENDETLKTLVIHNDVAVINFDNCNVESIIVSDDNELYSSQDGVLFSKDKTKLYRFPERSPLTEYVIPDTVTEIAEKAFDCCKNLKSVVIPDSVTEIEEWAFRYSKLTNVAVSKNTIIGKEVFVNLFDELEINYY